jgi:hypothetical protein
MTKDYLDYIQSVVYADDEIDYTDNQECLDEFYGCPEYKQYYEEWC